MSQRRGLETTGFDSTVALPPAGTTTAARSDATVFPAASTTLVTSVTRASLAPAFSRLVFTATAARASVTSGVVT